MFSSSAKYLAERRQLERKPAHEQRPRKEATYDEKTASDSADGDSRPGNPRTASALAGERQRSSSTATPERGETQMTFTTIGDTAGTEAQAPGRARVSWKEVILFVVLVYGMAWAWSGFILFTYLGALLTRSSTTADIVERLGPAATLGTLLTPMIAALIMRVFLSKEGVKGTLGLL